MTFRQVLEEKRDDLGNRIESIRQSVKELTDELATKEAQLRNIEELIRLEIEPLGTVQSGIPTREAATKEVLMDSVAALLTETGRPMHYQAITQKLVADGLHIPGRNPAANLLTQMTRDGRFRKTARGTYSLTRANGSK